jgi:hypothetical protein
MPVEKTAIENHGANISAKKSFEGGLLYQLPSMSNELRENEPPKNELPSKEQLVTYPKT